MTTASVAIGPAPDALQEKVHAAQASLATFGVIVEVRPPAGEADPLGVDGALWDPDTATLHIADDLPGPDQLAVMADLWAAITVGPQATRHAYIRRHLAAVDPARPEHRRRRRPLPTALGAALPLILAASCLYPATAAPQTMLTDWATTQQTTLQTVPAAPTAAENTPATSTRRHGHMHTHLGKRRWITPVPRRARRRPIRPAALNLNTLIASARTAGDDEDC